MARPVQGRSKAPPIAAALEPMATHRRPARPQPTPHRVASTTDSNGWLATPGDSAIGVRPIPSHMAATQTSTPPTPSVTANSACTTPVGASRASIPTSTASPSPAGARPPANPGFATRHSTSPTPPRRLLLVLAPRLTGRTTPSASHQPPLTPHASPRTPHASPHTPRPSPRTPRPSPRTPRPSPRTPRPHAARLAHTPRPHAARLTTHASPRPLAVSSSPMLRPALPPSYSQCTLIE